MAKDIRLESFKYHFLMGIETLELSDRNKVRKFLEHLDFERIKQGVIVRWDWPVAGEFEFLFSDFTFIKKAIPSDLQKYRKVKG